MSNITELIEKKKCIVEAVSVAVNALEREVNQVKMKWEVVGTKQKRDWRNGNELVWEDEEKTIPVMENEYADVPKTDEELTADDKMKIAAYESVMLTLQKAFL